MEIGNHLLTVMAPDGSVIEKVPNPRALRRSLADLRAASAGPQDRGLVPLAESKAAPRAVARVNLARLPASWAEALSDGKTAPVRRVAVKRVNHPGRVAL